MNRWHSLVAVVVVLLGPRLSWGKLPNDKFLPLTRDFNQRVLAMLQRDGVPAYNRVGSRDQRWDSKARMFIEESDRKNLRLKGLLAPEQVRELGEELMRLKCDDPLVLYLHGKALIDDNNGKGREFLERAVENFKDHVYPAEREVAAVRALWAAYDHWGNLDKTSPVYTRLVLDAFPRLMADKEFMKDRGVAVAQIYNVIENLGGDNAKAFYDAAVRAKDVDSVVLKAIEGLQHERMAWKLRGSGFANSVTPEGWKGMQKHMAAARTALTAAWEADPTLANVAEQMMSVCMVEGDRAGVRKWFDRAITARFDHMPAYGAYAAAIMPRWGGSLDEMIAFGIECAQTKRFDTQVPDYLIGILDFSRNETGGETTHWRRADVHGAIRSMYEGYIAAADEKRKPFYRSALAAHLVRGWQWDAAKAALGDAPIDPAGAKTAYFEPVELRTELAAFAGPWAALSRQAGKTQEDGELARASELYAQAAAKAKENAEAARHLRSLARAMLLQKEFETGKAVDITPTDADLAGWQAIAGPWSVQDGFIVCSGPAEGGARLQCLADFGSNYDIEMDVEAVKEDASYWGLFVAQYYGTYTMQAVICPGRATARVWYAENRPDQKYEPRPRMKLAMSKRGDEMTMSVDGKVLHDKIELSAAEHGVERVGLGVITMKPATRVRVTNIRIKRAG